MKAILLAAGYATRMYPLTHDKPKGLLPIKGQPVTHHILEKIKALSNVDEVFLVTNNKFYTHFQEWAKNTVLPVEVLNDGTLSNDDRLGSIGDLHFVLKQKNIQDAVLVVNADNLFTFDLSHVVRNSIASHIAAYDVKSHEDAKKFGCVKLASDKRVIDFVEKPASPPSTLCSVGIYYFAAHHIPLIHEYINKGFPSDKSGDLIQWMHQTAPIYAETYDSEEHAWHDIGSLDVYNKLKNTWEH